MAIIALLWELRNGASKRVRSLPGPLSKGGTERAESEPRSLVLDPVCHLGHLFKSFQVPLWSLCATLLKRYVLGEVRQLLEPGSEPRPVGFQGTVSHSVPPHKLVALLAPPTSLLQQIRLGSQQAQGILKIGRLTLLYLLVFPPFTPKGTIRNDTSRW